MRPFPLLLALALLSVCGPRTRVGEVPAGGACQSSAQCPIDHTCAGCSQEEAVCTPGCSTDEDCSQGHCEQVECVTCPCPGICKF